MVGCQGVVQLWKDVGEVYGVPEVDPALLSTVQ